MTEPEFIDGTAGRIAIHRLGGSGDRTLLVHHATGFLGLVYRALARELAESMQVVAFDFRAHGDSAWPDSEDGFNWLRFADDADAVIDHLRATEPNRTELHGFGHSMGGAALLEVERRRPGTYASAMVFEPIVPPGPFESETPIVTAARGRLRTFPSAATALQRYASKPPLGLFRADVLHDYVMHGFTTNDTDGSITLKCTPESEASTFAGAGHINLGQLPEIALDVIVAQSGDGALPAQLAPVVAEGLPNGRLQNFPLITHFGPLQDPVGVAQAIAEMVDAAS